MTVSTRRKVATTVVALVILTVGGAVYHGTVGVWNRLRSATAEFAPRGLDATRVRESGTTQCFVSCSGTGQAQIEVTYRSATLTSEQLCERVGEEARAKHEGVVVDTKGGDMPLGRMGCAYADVPSVGRRAHLVANPCFDAPRCVSVVFSSGLE